MRAVSDYVKVRGGFTMEMLPDDLKICRDLRHVGDWEPDVGNAIERYANSKWTFLDLGAHIGFFTLLATKLFKHVIAVEPNPWAYQAMVRSAAVNGVEFEAHNVAVTDHDGEAKMVFVFPNTGMSWIARKPKEESSPVRSKTLLQILGDRRPEFIKIDIEGCEYLALKDYPVETAQVIITEYSTSQLERSSGRGGQEYYGLFGGFDWFRMDGTPVKFEGLPTNGYENFILLRKGGY